MKIYLDKDHFRIGTESHFNLIYIWWGRDQWAGMEMVPGGLKRSNKRIYEIGFGWWSKQLFK